MRFRKKVEDAMWRMLEWSFVMGALSWVFVRSRIGDGWRLRGLDERRLAGGGVKPGAGDVG